MRAFHRLCEGLSPICMPFSHSIWICGSLLCSSLTSASPSGEIRLSVRGVRGHTALCPELMTSDDALWTDAQWRMGMNSSHSDCSYSSSPKPLTSRAWGASHTTLRTIMKDETGSLHSCTHEESHGRWPLDIIIPCTWTRTQKAEPTDELTEQHTEATTTLTSARTSIEQSNARLRRNHRISDLLRKTREEMRASLVLPSCGRQNHRVSMSVSSQDEPEPRTGRCVFFFLGKKSSLLHVSL